LAINPTITRTLNRTVKLISLILLLAGAGVFVLGADKSFDFTDEGLYLLVYQHPEEFPDSYTSYHRVGAVVSDLVSGNIVALRLIGFFLTSAATWYFGLALTWFLKGRGIPLLEDRRDQAFLHLALQGSVLAAYCWLPPTPNYNTMAGIGMLLSCGGIMAFFSTPDPRHSLGKSLFGLLVIGLGLLLAFLAKGSSAVGIAVVSVALLGACNIIRSREKVLFAVLATAAVLLGGICVFLLMPGLFKSWEFFLGSIVALTEGNGAREIIERHWDELLEFVMRHVRSFVFPVLLAFGVGIFSRLRLGEISSDRKSRVVFWLVAGILAVEVVLLIVRETYLGGISGRKKSFIGYSSLFLLLLALRAAIPDWRKAINPVHLGGFLLFLLWLAVLPFVTAAGTTHRIFINALLHAAPLSAATLLLASSLDKALRRGIVVPTVCLVIVALGFSQFLTGFVLSPYRTAPKWTQTVPVEIGVPSTVLKLDPASAECIRQTTQALAGAGFKPGDDILALYGLPGLVYAVGGVSPQKPWFFNDHGPDGDEANLRALKRIPAQRIRESFILWTDGDDRAASQLSACGIEITGEFEKVGETVEPFRKRKVGILKPLGEKAGGR
jgi:hypothetical protein